MTQKKLNKDIEQLRGCGIGLLQCEKLHWRFALKPITPPYLGGIFWFEIVFSHQYPFVCPQVRLLTKMFHPNFAGNGFSPIECLQNWKPATSVAEIAQSLSNLICNPEMDVAVNTEASEMYTSDRNVFNTTAEEWTKKYACYGDDDPCLKLNIQKYVVYEQLCLVFDVDRHHRLLMEASESGQTNLAISYVNSKLDADLEAEQKKLMEEANRDRYISYLLRICPEVSVTTVEAVLQNCDLELARAAATLTVQRTGHPLNREIWNACDTSEKLRIIFPRDESGLLLALVSQYGDNVDLCVEQYLEIQERTEKENEARKAEIMKHERKAILALEDEKKKKNDGWDIVFMYDAAKGPCQSVRSLMATEDPKDIVLRHVGNDNTAAYAAVCFERMIEREQEMEAKGFVVFYHAYNTACLIYEVQAEIARALHGLPDEFAPLPRLRHADFIGKSIQQLLADFPSMAGQDHHPKFRSVAISVSNTLFSFQSSAPPLNSFRQGYGCVDLSFRGLLLTLLKQCGASSSDAETIADSLVNLGQKYGLSVYSYHEQGRHYSNYNTENLGGHMLQIFVAKSIVDRIAYRSRPLGVQIKDKVPLSAYLGGAGGVVDRSGERLVDGQSRLMMPPHVFLDPTQAQLYHYCGNWKYLGGTADMEGSRAAFVLEMRQILKPLLGSKELVERAYIGIEGRARQV